MASVNSFGSFCPRAFARWFKSIFAILQIFLRAEPRLRYFSPSAIIRYTVDRLTPAALAIWRGDRDDERHQAETTAPTCEEDLAIDKFVDKIGHAPIAASNGITLGTC